MVIPLFRQISFEVNRNDKSAFQKAFNELKDAHC
jgi:hypothetical protein